MNGSKLKLNSYSINDNGCSCLIGICIFEGIKVGISVVLFVIDKGVIDAIFVINVGT